MATTGAVTVPPGHHPLHTPPRRRPAAATLLGLLATSLALAFPFLPVVQDTAELTWPTAAGGPVTAPLVALRPVQLTASVGCAALRGLDTGNVVSTTPPGAPDGPAVGLSVTLAGGVLTVDDRGERLATAPLPPGACDLSITSTATRTAVTLGNEVLVAADGDRRPQVVGIYSDLDAGAAVRVTVDNRFDSRATPLKMLVGGGAVLALLGSLWALRRVDTSRRMVRCGPRPQDRVRDGAVVGVLALWAVIGSITPDDGYILTMTRVAESAGWIGNYYRWFDVPEAPFGWFYELYRVWAGVSDAVLWLRVPALLMGLASWWLISRHLLPRLRVARNRAAGWAAATAFLCFWLPFGNGLRPEPLVVLGSLVAVCAVERAIATRRVLPLAVGLVAAAFAVAATPTGLLAAAPFLAAARPLLRVLRRRAAESGWATTLAPLAGVGTIVLVAIYADQTWSTVAEATRVHTAIGPNLPWSQESYRYQLLFSPGPDGSLVRRFPVLVLILCTVALVAVLLLRRGRIPGLAAGPVRRLVVTTVLGFGVLALTPTKWTHHFGAFAALGAGVAAVAAVALVGRRLGPVFLAALLAATALAFTGSNNWWYVSNWGVPWFDRAPVIGGIALSTVLLGGAAVVLVLGVVRPPRLSGAPLAVLCGLVVLLEIASLARGATRSPYPLTADAVGDPTGCGLSSRVLVETDPVPLAPAPGPRALLDGFAIGSLPPDATPPGPVVGPVSSSYGDGRVGTLRTSWFTLPATRDAPLVVGVAGPVGGDTEVAIELGRADAGGVQTVERLDVSTGSAIASTADPTGTGALGPGWRDVRFDLRGHPAADRVRVIARDGAADGWVAVTPPRVPRLTPLLDIVGDAPVFLDWPVALAHPCLRPSGIVDGVAEVPRFRVLADPQQRGVGEDWSAAGSGGPLAWITVTARQRVVPTYLRDDWGRDWGQLRVLERYSPAPAAPLRTTPETVWGWTDAGPIGDPP